MATFKKKVPEVQAFQWDGPGHVIPEIGDVLDTHEQFRLTLEPGDWIARNENRIYYVIKDADIQKNYDKVS